MIHRDYASILKNMAQVWPSVTLTGPRQCGKTTLCKSVFPDYAYINLEEKESSDFAKEDPKGFLQQFSKGVILDEIQSSTQLLPYIKSMIDDDRTPGRWILTGSQSSTLHHNERQPLVGRTAVQHLLPLTYQEIMRFEEYPASLSDVIVSGSYPIIYDDQRYHPQHWHENIVQHFVGRDIQTKHLPLDSSMIMTFLKLCAHQSGRMINVSSLASECKIKQESVKALLSVLQNSFIAFQLRGMYTQARMQYIKLPKLYFYDTGLLCWLLDIKTPEQYVSHGLRGAIFETWVVSEAIKLRLNLGKNDDMHFYQHRQTKYEADIVLKGSHNQRTIIEAKSSSKLSTDILGNTAVVKEDFEKAGNKVCTYVVYGGDTQKTQKDCIAIPWNHMHELPWKTFEDYLVYNFRDSLRDL